MLQLDFYLTGSGYDTEYNPIPDIHNASEAAPLAFEQALVQKNYSAAIHVLSALIKIAILDGESSEKIRLVCEGLHRLIGTIKSPADIKLLFDLVKDGAVRVTNKELTQQLIETAHTVCENMPKEFYLYAGNFLKSFNPVKAFEYYTRALNCDVVANIAIASDSTELQNLAQITATEIKAEPSTESVDQLLNCYQKSLLPANSWQLRQQLGNIQYNLATQWRSNRVEEFLQSHSNNGIYHASWVLARIIAKREKTAVADLNQIVNAFQIVLKQLTQEPDPGNNLSAPDPAEIVQIVDNCCECLKEFSGSNETVCELLFAFYKAFPTVERLEALKQYGLAKEAKNEAVQQLAEKTLAELAAVESDPTNDARWAYLSLCLKNAEDRPKLGKVYEQKIIQQPLPNLTLCANRKNVIMTLNAYADLRAKRGHHGTNAADQQHEQKIMGVLEGARLQGYINQCTDSKDEKETGTAMINIRLMADGVGVFSFQAKARAVCETAKIYRIKKANEKWHERTPEALEYSTLAIQYLDKDSIAFVGTEHRGWKSIRPNRRAYICAFLSIAVDAVDKPAAVHLFSNNIKNPYVQYLNKLVAYVKEKTPDAIFGLILNPPFSVTPSKNQDSEFVILENIRTVLMTGLNIPVHQFTQKAPGVNPESNEVKSEDSHADNSTSVDSTGSETQTFVSNDERPPATNPNAAQLGDMASQEPVFVFPVMDGLREMHQPPSLPTSNSSGSNNHPTAPFVKYGVS